MKTSPEQKNKNLAIFKQLNLKPLLFQLLKHRFLSIPLISLFAILLQTVILKEYSQNGALKAETKEQQNKGLQFSYLKITFFSSLKVVFR